MLLLPEREHKIARKEQGANFEGAVLRRCYDSSMLALEHASDREV